MKIEFKIFGIPQGKARPRVCRINWKSVTYTPKKTVEYERLIRASYNSVSNFKFKESIPLEMNIIALFPIPKSTSKKIKFLMLGGEILPTKKPDSDNIIKAICDALNGIAYEDDKQICRVYFEKKYCQFPCIKVEIKDITEG